MIKKTCNAAEQARMRRLGKEGYTVEGIARGMNLSVACVERNMKGHVAGIPGTTDDIPVAIVGGNGSAGEEVTPASKAAVATPPPAVPAPATPAPAAAPAAPAVDNRSPQQKAADTRAANKAAKEAEGTEPAVAGEGDGGDPTFLE